MSVIETEAGGRGGDLARRAPRPIPPAAHGAGEPPVMRKTWRVTCERDADERRAAAERDLAGGRDAPVELVEYDESWPGRFAAEAARLADVAPGVAWHHIGSTAVPGLAAKPIIDMMALVDDLDAPVRSLVDAGGYQYPEAYNATLVARRCVSPIGHPGGPTTCTWSSTPRSWRDTCASATRCAPTPNWPRPTPGSSATSPDRCRQTERATQQRRPRSSHGPSPDSASDVAPVALPGGLAALRTRPPPAVGWWSGVTPGTSAAPPGKRRRPRSDQGSSPLIR